MVAEVLTWVELEEASGRHGWAQIDRDASVHPGLPATIVFAGRAFVKATTGRRVELYRERDTVRIYSYSYQKPATTAAKRRFHRVTEVRAEDDRGVRRASSRKR